MYVLYDFSLSFVLSLQWNGVMHVGEVLILHIQEVIII